VEDDPRLYVPPALVTPTSAPVGNQLPANFHAPLWLTTAGDDAVDLAAAVGLDLFPWQQVALRNALGERSDGRWDAFEVGLIVPRQNGKNVVVVARELAGLFLFDEEQIIHTAHKFKTAKGAYRDLKKYVEGTPDLMKQVKSVPDSSDNTAIILHDGRRIDFLARQGGSGRGFSGDTVILDEAFALDPVLVSDLLPTLSARPAPQVWYTSSTGFADSVVLAEIRRRALEGEDKERRHLAYLEWTAEHVADRVHPWDSPEAVVASNPSLGYVQSWEWIEAVDLQGMTEEAYRRERLGIWATAETDRALPAEAWQVSTGSAETAHGRVVRRSVALEVTKDRDRAFVAGATELADGRVLVDLLEARDGVAWVADYLRVTHHKHRPHAGVVIDSFGGAVGLTHALTAARVPFTLATTRDLTSGTARLYDGLTRKDENGDLDPLVYHGTHPDLDDAAYTAGRRLVGQSKTAWTWRQNGEVPVEPLRAVTLALKGLTMDPVNKRSGRTA
jgi:hypothetical protein